MAVPTKLSGVHNASAQAAARKRTLEGSGEASGELAELGRRLQARKVATGIITHSSHSFFWPGGGQGTSHDSDSRSWANDTSPSPL